MGERLLFGYGGWFGHLLNRKAFFANSQIKIDQDGDTCSQWRSQDLQQVLDQPLGSAVKLHFVKDGGENLTHLIGSQPDQEKYQYIAEDFKFEAICQEKAAFDGLEHIFSLDDQYLHGKAQSQCEIDAGDNKNKGAGSYQHGFADG